MMPIIAGDCLALPVLLPSVTPIVTGNLNPGIYRTVINPLDPLIIDF